MRPLQRSRRAGLILGATSLAMALAAAPGAIVHAADQAVAIADFSYTPDSLTVSAGTVVTWTNQAGQPHTVTADDGTSFDSQPIGPNEAFANLFDTPGTYAYHCTIHPTQMKGTVIVTAAAPSASGAGTPEPTPLAGTLPPSFNANLSPPPDGVTPVPSTGSTGGSGSSTPLTAILLIGLGILVAVGVVVVYRRREDRRTPPR
jgi:plastocyanin